MNISFSKQVPKNLIVNIISFIISLSIGLWITPYLLNKIGVIAYGFVPLSLFFTQYLNVMLNSINMSINRYLLIALQKNDYREANIIFNTSFIMVLILITLILILTYIMFSNITSFFNIPNDLIEDVKYLFLFTLLGFSISIIRSVYGTSIYAYNRLDILRFIDISQNITRLFLIVLLFNLDNPSLFNIGIANLISSTIMIFPTLYYFKKFTPQLKLKISFLNKKYFKLLSDTSIWILINQVGVVLLGNLDLYIVNKTLGPEATGEYGIVLQVIILFRTSATLIGGVLSPVIMTYYANNNIDKLKIITLITSKLMIISMIIPLSILVYYSEYILELWIGSEYNYLNTLVSFSLLFFIFTIPIMPMYSINIAYNKVKIPSLFVLNNGIINVISVLFLLNFTNLGIWSIVLVKLILEFLYTALFMPYYISNILAISKKILYTIPLTSITLFTFLYMMYFAKDYFINLSGIADITSTVIIIVIVLVLSIKFILTTNEKRFIYEIIKRKFRNERN